MCVRVCCATQTVGRYNSARKSPVHVSVSACVGVQKSLCVRWVLDVRDCAECWEGERRVCGQVRQWAGKRWAGQGTMWALRRSVGRYIVTNGGSTLRSCPVAMCVKLLVIP